MRLACKFLIGVMPTVLLAIAIPLGWLYLNLPHGEAAHEIRAALPWALLVALSTGGALCAAALVWLVRRLLQRPIARLQATMVRIAHCPSRLRIEVPDGDEFGDLARGMETMSATLSDQIDARISAEGSLERIKDLYAVLGGVNRAIVRLREREQLFAELCRIALEHCRFSLVWIGMPDETGWFRPVAVAGPAAGLLDEIRVSNDPTRVEGRGTMGRAWRGGWAVENSMLLAPAMAPWHEPVSRYGIGAVASFVLREEGRPLACLCLYAGEEGFFRSDLVELLRDLAEDLSFALDAMHRADQRDRAEAALREAEERWHFALEGSGDGVWDYDVPAGRIIASARCLELLGYSRGQLSEHYEDWEALMHPEDLLSSREAVRQHLAGETERFVHEHRLRAADGRWLWFRITGKIMRRDAGGEPTRMLGTLHDITASREAQERVAWLGQRDALTGLPNRALLGERLDVALAHAAGSGGRIALMFLDLDRFKTLNDTLGHAIGDALLREVAVRLLACVRSEDTVSRRGGDEFVVLLAQAGSAEYAEQIASRILQRLSEPYLCAGRTVYTSASIGIALYPDDAGDAEALLRCADAAMYAAKGRGRNAYQPYNRGLSERAERRNAVERALRAALDAGSFELHFQPQAWLDGRGVVRAEALLRDRGGLLAGLSPAEFIPVAEECGLIEPLGEWVLAEACRQARAWADSGLPLLPIAINLSPVQFRRGDIAERVAQALAKVGLGGEWLEIEMTESLVMRDIDSTAHTLHQLKALGVRLAIDDFGTSYSSLSSLRHLPLDRLKIDRSFVRALPGAAADAGLVQAIVDMARALGLQTVAEGVETREQHDFLRAIGCNQYQGYWLAPPCDATAFARWLDRPAKITHLVVPGGSR